MAKRVWNGEKGGWEWIEVTKLDKFLNLWNNLDWSKILLIIFSTFVALFFIWGIASLIYMSTPAYCEAKSLAYGFDEFKYVYPECYIKTPDLGWYSLDEYVKAINLH